MSAFLVGQSFKVKSAALFNIRLQLYFTSESPSLCAGGKKGKKGNVNGKKSEESDIFKLVKMIMQRNFDPGTAPALIAPMTAHFSWSHGLILSDVEFFVLVSIQTISMADMSLEVLVSSLSKNAIDGAFGSQCGQMQSKWSSR